MKDNFLKQHNNSLAWLLMGAYWMVGFLIGQCFGYFPFSNTTKISYPHLVAVLVTLGMQPRILSRFTCFDRKLDLPAALVFSVVNGLCETILFLASFDFGKYACRQSHIAGFICFFAYSGLIHAKFWEPYGFPQHIDVNAPPFFLVGLPELSAISAAWIGLYTATNDVRFVCMLHVIHNFFFARKIHLQSPFVHSYVQYDGATATKKRPS
jgi:hypothetical protein